jgi:ribonuclease P/MRP protein subunit POP5
MTVRPPTLRDKRRYLLVRVEPPGTAIDQKELYYAVADAVTSLWGDMVAAAIVQAVICADGDYVVFRCRRGTERELAIALSTITRYRDLPVALRIIAASGTIDSLQDRMKKTGEPVADGAPAAECRFGGKECLAVHCDGQKVDVIEKGFKNTHRVFLTKEDLEEPYATTIPDGI